MGLKIATVTIDCEEPEPVGCWWAEALGWRITYEGDDEWVIEPPEGENGVPLLFIKVPEQKTIKNRFHLDLRPDDRDAEVARLEAMGAVRTNVGQDPDAVSWVVLSDPFGNEFCVLRVLTAEEIAEGRT
jgi:hypothetical protein